MSVGLIDLIEEHISRRNNKKMEKGMSPLRKARLARGLSIYELADAVGISAASISRLERGIQSTSPATAARLAELFGLTLAQVLLPESNEAAPSPPVRGDGADGGLLP